MNRLSELKSQMAMLDLQSTVGSTISLIHDLKGMLFASESWSPDTDREWQIYHELHAAIQPWVALGGEYDQLWQAGKERDEKTMADIRQRVEALRKATPLPKLIQDAASFQEDEAKRQRIIAIGIMIAAALVAAVTGGLASGAIGGAAGAIVGAGLEALTFTAITGTLNRDQTFGGFMAELGDQLRNVRRPARDQRRREVARGRQADARAEGRRDDGRGAVDGRSDQGQRGDPGAV